MHVDFKINNDSSSNISINSDDVNESTPELCFLEECRTSLKSYLGGKMIENAGTMLVRYW